MIRWLSLVKLNEANSRIRIRDWDKSLPHAVGRAQGGLSGPFRGAGE